MQLEISNNFFTGASASNKIVKKLKERQDLAYLKRLKQGLTDDDNYTVPGIKMLADMITTGESKEDYEKRRRTVNTLPHGRKRKVLPAYDPVVISRLLICLFKKKSSKISCKLIKTHPS